MFGITIVENWSTDLTSATILSLTTGTHVQVRTSICNFKVPLSNTKFCHYFATRNDYADV